MVSEPARATGGVSAKNAKIIKLSDTESQEGRRDTDARCRKVSGSE